MENPMVVGIITGLISSAIITICIEIFHAYKERKDKFLSQRDRYSKYLKKLQVYLTLAFKEQNSKDLLLFLESYEAYPQIVYCKDNIALSKASDVQELLLGYIEKGELFEHNELSLYSEIGKARIDICKLKFKYWVQVDK